MEGSNFPDFHLLIFIFFSLHAPFLPPVYQNLFVYTVWSGFNLAFCPACSVSEGLVSSQVIGNVTMWTEESSFCFTYCANVGGGSDFKEASENLFFLDQSSYHPVQKVIANAV